MCFAWGDYDFDSGCRNLAKKLVNMKKLAGKRVAVLNLKPKDRLMSSFIARNLLNSLASIKNRNFELVDRLEITTLMDEAEIYGEEGYNPPQFEDKENWEIENWIKKLHADYVVLGFYTWNQEKRWMKIDCRAVNPLNGTIVGSVSVKVKLTRYLERILNSPAATGAAQTLENVWNITSINNSNTNRISIYFIKNKKKIPLNNNNPVVHLNDKIGFSIIPPFDCKLYVFNYDPVSKEVVFLYPLPDLPLMEFKKGKIYFFPECLYENDSISYTVKPPPSRVCFKVIGVSAKSSIDFVKDLKKINGYYVLTSTDMKKILDKLSLIPKAGWFEKSLNIWILP